MTILRTNTIAGVGTTTFGPTLDGKLEFNSQNYVVLPKGTSTQEGVLRTTADVVGTGGTYYDNLVLAMPFNEATGLRDVSSRNRNPGTYGNVAISTVQSKYYGSSAYFDGSGDYIGFSTTSDFVFGSGNFTIEGWFYLNGTGQQHIFENRGGSNTNTVLLNIDASTRLSVFLNGSYRINGSALSTGTWYHFALVKNGGTTTLYQNGSSLGTYADSNTYVGPQNGNTYIGVDDGPTGSYLNGYLQDLRIYKGLAKYTANFTPPERIAELGVGFKAGQLRYNTDSNKVELYDGSQWTEVQASRPDLNGGARGVFGGGAGTPTYVNNIEYITISSTGNAIDFGDMSGSVRAHAASCSSSTRGLFGGGYTATPGATTNTIDYITISSTGDAQDFGDLTVVGRGFNSSCSSATRGLFGGGRDGSTLYNIIDYVTIASQGVNAQDFGDLSSTKRRLSALSSPTRGVFAGGTTGSNVNVIEFVTISTLGNAQDFGDLIAAASTMAGCSSPVRGLFSGGFAPSFVNTIQYITIATLGNAVNFGSLTTTPANHGACSSPTRGVFAGGYTPTLINNIEYVTINTQSNSVDFGDLIVPRQPMSGLSNAHGGL